MPTVNTATIASLKNRLKTSSNLAELLEVQQILTDIITNVSANYERCRAKEELERKKDKISQTIANLATLIEDMDSIGYAIEDRAKAEQAINAVLSIIKTKTL